MVSPIKNVVGVFLGLYSKVLREFNKMEKIALTVLRCQGYLSYMDIVERLKNQNIGRSGYFDIPSFLKRFLKCSDPCKTDITGACELLEN